MSDDSIIPREHYVYALFREDGIRPFYIGMGKGNRMLQHSWPRYNKHGSLYKRRIIAKMLRDGLQIPSVKLIENLTETEAAEIEIALIQLLGRHPNGPLTNLTRGGDGLADLSLEAKERRIAGMKRYWTPENRAAHRQAVLEVQTPELRAKIGAKIRAAWEKKNGGPPKPRSLGTHSEAMKRKWADPEKRARLIIANKKARDATQTSEARQKRRESIKRSWQDPARAALNKHSDWSPETLAKRSRIMSDPEVRAKLDAGNSRPDVRERRIASLKATLATPEAKANRSAGLKKMWQERRGYILEKRRSKNVSIS